MKKRKMKMSELPVFKFALREDLKDKKEFLPTRVHHTDTGWDVRAAFEDHKDVILSENDKILLPLGFKAISPVGWWFKVVPRSSTFAKKHLNCLYGTVDQCYEGFVYLSCHFQPPHDYQLNEGGVKKIEIKFGDRIAQIIPVKRQDMFVKEVSNEEYDRLCKQRNGTRGDGGFGSSKDK